MRNSPVPRSEFDLLVGEINRLRRRVDVLSNQHVPTVPVYLPDVPDDAVDGQFALVPGVPPTAGGGFVPDGTNSSDLYDGSANVSAGGESLSWASGGGADLLDLSTPTLPTVKVAGVYAFDIGISGLLPAGAARLNLVLPGGNWSSNRTVYLPVDDPNDAFRFFEFCVVDYLGLTDTISLAASYPLLVGTSVLSHLTTVQRIT